VAALGLAMSVALLALPPPEGMPMAAKQVAAVGILMAALWISEIVPLAAAALVPLATFPLAAIATFERTAQSYADPLIFLFMGGFMLSAAIERWGLHRRVARLAVAVSGRRPDALMLAMMGATAFLSLWVSNTASAMVMVPMAGALAGTGDGGRRADGNEAFRAALLLAIAYSATIGGIGSLIGTPPNAMLAAYMHKSHGLTIGFGQWMLIGVPIVLVLLPVVWLLLTRFAFRLPAELPPDAIALSRSSLSRPQRLVAGVLVATAAAWIARPFLAKATGWTGLHDAGIAIVAVLVLFGMPQRWSGAPALLEWKDVEGIRWDVLILFGGGLALADGVASTGLAAWIGGQLQHIGGMPVLLMVLVMMIVVVYLGELASNTAVAAIFLPVAGAAATGLGARPIEVVLPIALAASLGFMLPVATPPNAIAYGTGAIPAKEMLKAGAALDVVSILIVFALATVLVPLVFPAP
jgi:sodium-dependent dicarboxylate transporter 2/3/5